jgi:ferrous iron transport protein B
MGAIRREMNSAKWTAFAIGYQCLFAYVISLIVYQLGAIFTSDVTANVPGVIVAVLLLAGLFYMIFRPATRVDRSVKATSAVEASAPQFANKE